MKKFLKKVFEIIEKFLDSETSDPVLKPLSPEKNRNKFSLKIDTKGISDEVFFDHLKNIVLNTPKTSSKNFFNQLFGGRNKPSFVAEMLTTVMNNSMYTYKVAGVHIAIEKEVLQTMLEYVGFQNGDGAFMPGGSISNMTAMMVARNEKQQNLSLEGFSGKKFVVYTSDQSHYSIEKNASILGIGQNNVRKIISDEKGKMNISNLKTQIKSDLEQGLIPFFVNATAGTTVLGAFDPLEEIAEVSKKYNLWMHVDAAWGGGVFLNQNYKHLLKGAEKSDSITWNAHKMMNVPLSASVVLCKKKGLLYRYFSMKEDYLFQTNEDEWNLGLSSLQCGRRNDAFKVWAAWKYYGKEGYEARVEKQFLLAKYATELVLKSQEFFLVLEPEFLNVCFQVKGISEIDLCNHLYEKGILQVSYGTWNGKSFIRLILVNPDMDFCDIDDFFETLQKFLRT